MGRVNRIPLRSLLAGGIAAVGFACTELPPAPVTPPAERLLFRSGCETIPACRSCTLSLVALDANNDETLLPNVTWSSSGPFATVDPSGRVTGVAAGGVTIRAEVSDDPMIFAEKDVTILSGSPACGA